MGRKSDGSGKYIYMPLQLDAIDSTLKRDFYYIAFTGRSIQARTLRKIEGGEQGVAANE